jgi:hypothetical protein
VEDRLSIPLLIKTGAHTFSFHQHFIGEPLNGHPMAQAARQSLLENILLSTDDAKAKARAGLQPVCISIETPVSQCLRPGAPASLNHPRARVVWQLQQQNEQHGAHRVVVIDILHAPKFVEAVFLFALPAGAFVDPNEVGSGLVSVRGQSVDLEARSDMAQPQLVVVRAAVSTLLLPIHFRYPPLSKSQDQLVRVPLPFVPSVWIKETPESVWAEITSESKSSFPYADVPCGREQDVTWVRIVAACTGMAGLVLLVGRKVLEKMFPRVLE